jgi:hypothetical protein
MTILELIRSDDANMAMAARAPHLALLYCLAMEQHRKGIVAELGTGPDGRSTRALLAAAGIVLTVDNQDRSFKTDHVCQFVKDDTAAASKLVEDHSVALLFVDGNHEREAVLRDLLAWEPKMMDSGIIVGHDWDLEAAGQDGVKAAVFEYLAMRDPEKKRWELQIYRADVSCFILWPR